MSVGYASLLRNFIHCTHNYPVKIADGSHSKVTWFGLVPLSKDITLKSVLLVPNLDCKLLSISQLTNDMNCIIKFTSYNCVFQDSDSGTVIGNAKMFEGLYILKSEGLLRGNLYPPRVFLSLMSSSVWCQSKDGAIILWHPRLGHPNSVYLSKLFPSLFVDKEPKFFQCENFQLPKHVPSSYQSIPYECSRPSLLIHSDVWAPLNVKNIIGSKLVCSFYRRSWSSYMAISHERSIWSGKNIS